MILYNQLGFIHKHPLNVKKIPQKSDFFFSFFVLLIPAEGGYECERESERERKKESNRESNAQHS